ncbi:hypothetical protein [Streptomyces sp. TRM68416]|uniref:hypothetical protein n=1 Tax=Streptomyces sp. TRM68416 TaxID=2758412 RepID=UPI001661E522|nr:hypothetical protein [Streptomyces sp. TRM68416]MBD0844574.1 hypothetical protein [Streptomyces sp. TRM68416]
MARPSEASRALVAQLAEQPDAPTVIAHVHVGRSASAAVARAAGSAPTDERQDGEIRWRLRPSPQAGRIVALWAGRKTGRLIMRSRRTHRWRLLTWLVLAFNLAMLLWLVVALDAAENDTETCVGDLCREANDPASATGTWLVVLVWLTGTVLLTAAWLITHHTERPSRGPRRGWHR